MAIALVGILFSMMAPVLARAKGKAFEVYSLNNLRNISVAQQLFALDKRPISAPRNFTTAGTGRRDS